jgi:hypothetical protein
MVNIDVCFVQLEARPLPTSQNGTVMRNMAFDNGVCGTAQTINTLSEQPSIGILKDSMAMS